MAQGDNCADAPALSCGDALVGQLGSLDNSDDLPESCVVTMGAPVWYTITGTGDIITIDVTPIGWDAEVGVYEAACGDTNGTTCVDGVDGAGTDGVEQVSWTSTPGVVYLVAVGHWIQGSTSDVFDIAVSCAAPPPLCPDGFVEVSSNTYCYLSDEVDAVVTEACPSSPTETVCITIQVGDWETGFDNLTFYAGAAGTGTGGAIVAGPLDGDLFGTQVCTTVAGECLTMISNSDSSVSCDSGSRPTAEYTVCESVSCDADNGTLNIGTGN